MVASKLQQHIRTSNFYILSESLNIIYHGFSGLDVNSHWKFSWINVLYLFRFLVFVVFFFLISGNHVIAIEIFQQFFMCFEN